MRGSGRWSRRKLSECTWLLVVLLCAAVLTKWGRPGVVASSGSEHPELDASGLYFWHLALYCRFSGFCSMLCSMYMVWLTLR